MPLTDAAKHRMLNHLVGNTATGAAITHASLHSANPGTSGANELNGGSPAYARKSLTFESAAGTETAGSVDVTNAPAFDVPAGASVAWIGYWTAATGGTFMGWSPAGGGALKPFNVDDASTDVLDAKSHGFSNGDSVVVWAAPGGTLPTGLSEGTIYFARDVATDSLKLAATSGGAAIDLTAIGSGSLQRIVAESFGAQGTYTLTDADLAIS